MITIIIDQPRNSLRIGKTEMAGPPCENHGPGGHGDLVLYKAVEFVQNIVLYFPNLGRIHLEALSLPKHEKGE